MCGIVGLLKFNHKQVKKDELEIILSKLQHRGRDHCGLKIINPIIGFGHRRLSIIDLHPSANQPMSYANEKLWLTYNGEIYNYLELKNLLVKKNYSFNTHSDSEVILAAYHYWGEDCLKYLNGMFAFAIWDENKKELFCARDQIGIKPFYYLLNNEYFAFASESTALIHLTQKKINSNAFYSYLMSMYVPTTESIFKDIFKLPAATYLKIKLTKQAQLKKYWDIEQIGNKKLSPGIIDEVEINLKNAIKRQLRSDVKVGGLLSGGIDSSIITALVSEQQSTFYTYSVGFEGKVQNELPYAKKIAEKFNTIHTELFITADEAIKNLDKAIAFSCEPIADPAIVPSYMLASLASNDGVKVLLNGTGGDEIFAGYSRYTGELSFKRRLFQHLPFLIKRVLANFPLSIKLKLRLRSPLMDMLFSTGGAFELVNQMIDKKTLHNLFVQLMSELAAHFRSKLPLLYQHMLFDLKVYLVDELLFLLDQMTMANTIEGRVPFLDINLVQTAYAIEWKAHTQYGETKSILKKIALSYLGTDYIKRSKQGFAGSSYWWVKQQHHHFMETIHEMKNWPWFENLKLDNFQLNRLNIKTANEIFIMYCFGRWYENIKSHG